MSDIIALYNELTFGPPIDDDARVVDVLTHPGTTLWGADQNGQIIAMCTLHLLPNPTWSGRAYGLIENVVTAAAHRNRGHGRAVLQAALASAWDAGAYKVMLLTGAKRGAAGFYKAVGFSEDDKTGLIIRARDTGAPNIGA